jgi:hypothetical protein
MTGARMPKILVWSITLLAVCVGPRAHAWGADGHRTVGALAQQLIADSHAAKEVRALLGELSLADATLWADCAKGVKPDEAHPEKLVYGSAGRFPECQIFETPEGQAEMIDFVQRNLKNCHPEPNAEDCHRQYHYTDLNLLQPTYRLGVVGARDDDVIAAITATIRVLQGKPAPVPFEIKSKREALLLLAHYVGDIHQPLHVGAVYLNLAGKRVNPDKSGLDLQTETRGGNELMVDTRRLHALWDDVSPSQRPQRINAAWVASAKAIPATGTQLEQFSKLWARQSLVQAREAFRLVTFAPRVDKQWPTTLPSDYPARMALVKKTQLTAAGAHLAEVLKLVWP